MYTLYTYIVPIHLLLGTYTLYFTLTSKLYTYILYIYTYTISGRAYAGEDTLDILIAKAETYYTRIKWIHDHTREITDILMNRVPSPVCTAV